MCTGATSVFGGIGCSTSENPPPVSSAQAMKRTPTEPRSTALPSFGPRMRGPWLASKRTLFSCAAVSISISFSVNNVSVEARALYHSD